MASSDIESDRIDVSCSVVTCARCTIFVDGILVLRMLTRKHAATHPFLIEENYFSYGMHECLCWLFWFVVCLRFGATPWQVQWVSPTPRSPSRSLTTSKHTKPTFSSRAKCGKFRGRSSGPSQWESRHRMELQLGSNHLPGALQWSIKTEGEYSYSSTGRHAPVI